MGEGTPWGWAEHWGGHTVAEGTAAPQPCGQNGQGGHTPRYPALQFPRLI